VLKRLTSKKTVLFKAGGSRPEGEPAPNSLRGECALGGFYVRCVRNYNGRGENQRTIKGQIRYTKNGGKERHLV